MLIYFKTMLFITTLCRIAPIMKVSNCRSYGSLVLVEGTDMTEAKKIALKLSKMLGMVYINGFILRNKII